MLGDENLSKTEVFEIHKAPQVWEFDDWKLQANGGMVLPFPMPNPGAISVEGINNLSLSHGDLVMVARDNSNNKEYNIIPLSESKKFQLSTGPKDGSEREFILHPELASVEEIKDYLIGIVDRVEGKRVIMKHHFRTRYGEEGWPKVGGAVTRVVGRSKYMIDERETDRQHKLEKDNKEKNHVKKTWAFKQGSEFKLKKNK